ncbi:MAG: GNAT family N-acetyltransferase [Anaeroplasma bactoclasticum]|nr:GNAT family N-acetyltransferase [Anaeroplasma bactoclasticum]
MIKVRYAKMNDKSFWYQLDHHLPEKEFEHKVKEKRGYVLLENEIPIGLLRYNLFWDSIPFCTMLFIDKKVQGQGYGTMLMKYWEEDMKKQGYRILLVSTQVDETAQHFYRKLGYQDCGGLILHTSQYPQPMEMFLMKEI